MIFGFGAIGLILTMGVVFSVRYLRLNTSSTDTSMRPRISLFFIGLGMTAWTLWAAYHAPSCGISFKGVFSLLLIWTIFLLWPILNFSKIVYNNNYSGFILVVSVLSLVVQIFNWGLLSNFWYFNKPSGLFTEPSHVAMYLLPIIGYRLMRNFKDFLALGSIIVIIVFFNSATFLVGLMLIASVIVLKKFIQFPNKMRFLLFAISLTLIPLALVLTGYLDVSILTERIEAILWVIQSADHAGITNASAIVWLNGWSQAYDTLRVTSGFGLGINQMGCGDFLNIGRFSDHIGLWTGGVVLNSNDGSFLIAKLVAELGLLGFCIASFLLIKSLLSIYDYVTAPAEVDDASKLNITVHAIGGICILILLFIRSNGYFLEPVILNLSLLFYGMSNKEMKIFKSLKKS
jgi:hypothetical protein